MIRVSKPQDSNERWIIKDGKVERWFIDKIGDVYITLRKTRIPDPNITRIMARKDGVYMTEQEAKKAAGLE